MKEVYEPDVYRLAEELSDLIWEAYDQWTPKAQNTLGYQIIRSSDSIAANDVAKYKALVDCLGPKLNAFIKSTRPVA